MISKSDPRSENQNHKISHFFSTLNCISISEPKSQPHSENYFNLNTPTLTTKSQPVLRGGTKYYSIRTFFALLFYSFKLYLLFNEKPKLKLLGNLTKHQQLLLQLE